MEGGFRIEFGSSELPGRKWAAAAAVLADRGLHSLTYIDVRIPTRPAVGGSSSQPSTAVESLDNRRSL